MMPDLILQNQCSFIGSIKRTGRLMNAIRGIAAAVAAALTTSACGGTLHHTGSQQAAHTGQPTTSASYTPAPSRETKLCNRFKSDYLKYRGEPVHGSTVEHFASQLAQLSHAAYHDYQDASLANALGDAGKWLLRGWNDLKLTNEGDAADKALSAKYGHKALHAIQTAFLVCVSNGA